MTPKLVAEYAELANKYLDQIPVENASDFEVVAEALKSITDSNQTHTLPDSLKGRISDLKEIVDNPDMYVQKQEQYQEFKNIILTRVAAKINEFKQLTSEEKEKYIAEQAKIKNETQQKHTEMAQHQPPSPTSEAHTISEQEMLLEQQRQYQTESSNVDPSVARLRSFLLSQDQQTRINIARLAAQDAGYMDTADFLESLPSNSQISDREESEDEVEREVEFDIESDIEEDPNSETPENPENQ